MVGLPGYSASRRGDVEVRLLEDVGRVDAPLQPAVEAQPHHLPQSPAVAGEQLRQRRLVSPHGLLHQGTHVVGHGMHPLLSYRDIRPRGATFHRAAHISALARLRLWGQCFPGTPKRSQELSR